MKHYIKGNDGRTYEIDFFEVITSKGADDFIGYYVGNIYHKTQVYYRAERTWDDHMGNTPCGYYTLVPLPTGERKRVYIYK